MFPNLPNTVTAYFMGFGLAFIVSLGLGGLLVLAYRKSPALFKIANETVNHPHNEEVMAFGGIAVLLSFLAAIWLVYALGEIDSSNFKALMMFTLGSLAMSGLGFYDDLFDCAARFKLFLQMLIATLMFAMGLRVDDIGIFHMPAPLSFALAILWMVGMANSVNLIDGLDGLASGVVMLSLITLFFVYLGRDLHLAAFFSIVLGGSLLGFFFLNFPPARIILGDTGSLPIGLLAAMIALLPPNQGFASAIYYVIPTVTLLYPVVDSIYSFIRRTLRGINPFRRDERHFHHRLVRTGISPVKTLLFLLGASACFNVVSLIPIFYINLIPNFVPLFVLFILAVTMSLLTLLEWFEKRHGIDFDREERERS